MYSPRGVLDLANSDDEMVALARRGNAMRLAGIDAELLDRAGLVKFVPLLNLDVPRRYPIVGGLLQRRGGTVRHDAVAWGYARAAAALGVDIVEHCEVTGLSTAAGIATGVETSRGPIRAERVVFAVAGHTGQIGTMVGMPLPVETHLLQAMVTEPIKPLLHTVLIYMYAHAEVYIAQSDRGGLVMGGALDGFPSYAREPLWHRVEEVVQSAVALLPQIAGIRILRHWAGTNDQTMDGSPLIDRMNYDNVFLNGGWCYGGFKAIPASGAACATLVATGNAPDLIRNFRISRFATGHMLDEKGRDLFPCASEHAALSLFNCPYCGWRSIEEFSFHKTLPNVEGGAFARIYQRNNDPLVSHEHWQHRLGCRSWLYVRRNPSTGAIFEVRNLTGAGP